MSELTRKRFRTLRVGSLHSLGSLIELIRTVAPQSGVTFPPWQGMQYLRDMYSGRGKLEPLDNARYPELSWTPVKDVLRQRAKAG